MTHFKIVRYPTEDHAKMDTALFDSFLRASEGKDLQALMRVVRNGKRLNREMERVIATLLADYPFVYDMTKYGWETVGEKAPPLENDYDYLNLQPLGIPPTVSGEGIIDFAKRVDGNLSQVDAERMLDNPALVPVEWPADIIFTGTLWVIVKGGTQKFVPCLSKDNKARRITFRLLESCASANYSVLCRRSFVS